MDLNGNACGIARWSSEEGKTLRDGSKVDLWRWSLLANDVAQEHFWNTLSSDERDRAERFRFLGDQRRYIVARGMLRATLATYLERQAGAVALTRGECGKPELADPAQRARLNFNLSHSDDIAVLAVSDGVPIGIDVERIRPWDADLARHAFADDEVAMLEAMPPELRNRAFTACWTRKEAYVKAVGVGLSMPLNRFAVSVDPTLPARLLRVDGDPLEVDRWTFVDVFVQPGYAAALVVCRRNLIQANQAS